MVRRDFLVCWYYTSFVLKGIWVVLLRLFIFYTFPLYKIILFYHLYIMKPNQNFLVLQTRLSKLVLIVLLNSFRYILLFFNIKTISYFVRKWFERGNLFYMTYKEISKTLCTWCYIQLCETRTKDNSKNFKIDGL